MLDICPIKFYKKIMKLTIKFLSFFLLFACATTKTVEEKTITFSKGIQISTEHFLDIIPSKAQIVQLITYKRQNDVKKAQIIMRKDKSLKVSVLSTMGIELLALSVNKGIIEQHSAMPGFRIGFFHRVMADMLAVYAPKTLFYQDIIGKVEVEDTALKRTILTQGKKLITIIYDNKNRWLSNIKYIHHQLDYELEIKNLSIAYEGLH